MADDQENKTERVQLLMAPSEVEAIDDWGFKNRIRTRAEAIRRLCQMALHIDGRRQGLAGSLKNYVDANKTFGEALLDFARDEGLYGNPEFRRVLGEFAQAMNKQLRMSIEFGNTIAMAGNYRNDDRPIDDIRHENEEMIKMLQERLDGLRGDDEQMPK